MPAFTKDHKRIKLNTSYPEDQYAVLEIWNEYNILEDIKCGPYSKKSSICRIQSLDMPLWEHTMMRPDHHDPNALDNMKPWKRYCFHKFTMSSCYGKDVTEMQSPRALPRVYSTYEFDEVCADDELQTKKIIKFRLGGRAHSLTLLEFARSREENLGLSRSHTSTIKNLILRVIYKMITYGLYQRTTRYDKEQKNDMWLLSMFDARHQNGVLTEDVVRILSAPIYCRDLDTTTLREFINSCCKLIPRTHSPGVQDWYSQLQRASMQDLYDRMGRMEIRQEAIERMEYSVPLQGAYNPPGYAQPQYDQYYQQYPLPPPQYPPQYQQQQQDDDK
ncbi:hypothetical protein Tco_0145455 [Tanacetum coccineum]